MPKIRRICVVAHDRGAASRAKRKRRCEVIARDGGGVRDVKTPPLRCSVRTSGRQMATRDCIRRDIGARVRIVEGVQP